MTDKKFSFNEQGAKRIVNVVREVERTEFHPANRKSFYTDTQYPLHNFIPVRITGVEIGSSGGSNLHSWERVELGIDGLWVAKPEWDKGGPDYSKPEKSLLHPDNLAIEIGAIVLAHWSVDQEFLLAENDHIIAYKLLEAMTGLNDTAKAKAVDGNGTEYGPEIYVVMDQFLKNQYGPALEGWYGYASFSPARNASLPAGSQQFNVIHQQRFAKNIDWRVSAGLESCGPVVCQLLHYYDGEMPVSASVELPACFPCECYKGEQCGSATYCPDESSNMVQVYHITLIDQLPYIAKVGECAEDACVEGVATKNIRIGDGLNWEREECEDFGCLGILSNPGVKVTGKPCTTGEDAGGEPVLQMEFKAPLQVEIAGECPKVATISLPENLVTGQGDDCINLAVKYEDCKYKVEASFNAACIPDPPDPPSVTVVAGDCVSVETEEDENGNKTITVSSDYTISAIGDDCITLVAQKNECDLHIEAQFNPACIPPPDPQLLPKVIAGECIVVNEGVGANGETTYTVDNDMLIKAGPGIKVDEQGCTIEISADPVAGPMTTVQVLCDVDISLAIVCVETSGGWELQATPTITKTYASLSLPSAYVTEGCGSSGSSGSTPDPEPEDPTITFDRIVCKGTPYIEYTIAGMGGADHYTISISGSDGCSDSSGASFSHEEQPGSAYWFYPQCTLICGASYTLTATYYDASNNVIDSTSTTMVCTEDDTGNCTI